MEKEKYDHLVFNGKTWLIILIAIFSLLILGLGAMTGLFYTLISLEQQDTLKVVEIAGIPAIPMVVVKGIIQIIERLTKPVIIKKNKGE